MKRGDVVTVALPGDFGKPRRALVIQSDHFSATATVTALLVTSTPVDAPLLRIAVPPDEQNGLKTQSYIMIDKIMTFYRDRVGQIIGSAGDGIMLDVERALTVFLGIAK
ncbi:growth inhibitor PemK [Rhodoblastus sphagnicola]|uniref:Growth inhibitor PemK n=1 Tax=Rhodoblastus sphagnicola TaxID=333368 RepID=A0A2S6N4U0_9HYPH|nr:type II toxin-antitoxin system PemK/MazF family toxin [Rhodoblastus sphagnicola]MBB4199616.1 mRNA interferase MazF [Rhodoblastus sphagnicola]PPQ29622.1 growth inhibitor PemK [Rhodoblastus sphagnicola]